MASKLTTRRTGHRSLRGTTKLARRYHPALEPVEPRLLLTAFAYFVDALTDTGAGTGFSGDLRYAITQANLNPGSTITIDTSGTVDLTSALPDIAVDMSIVNPDPGDFLLQGGGNGSNYRALTIDSDVSAIISGVDFTNFATTGNGGILMVDGSLGLVASDLSLSSASSGGAVYISTQGSMTANGSSFHDNSSLNSGGAIDCDNDLNLIGGSLLNNSAGGSGGAVAVDGLMNAYGVEIAGNVASNLGGGIEASDGMGPSGLTITNSTIAENAAENVGGGVMAFISPTLTNDTIAGNSSAVSQGGAGLYIYAGVQPLLKNTLIAQNLSNDIESDVDGMGPTASIDPTSSFNLIGNTSVSGISDGSQGNQIGSSVSPLDAELGPLTNNGGTNETIAPNAGSPALAAGLIANAVDPTTSDPIPFDQRGIGSPRVFNNTIDIGAYQTQATATNLSVQAASGTYGGTRTLTATLTTGGVPIAGELVDIHLGASDLGTMVTDVNGDATFNNVSLSSLNVGSYTGDISAGFGGDSNFAASSGSADLTVTPAPLTITANDQAKVYGAALPTLTASYTGFVNGDTSASLTTAPTITTTATAASHVAGSPYAITASGAVDTDYTISYVDGSLTISQAPLIVVIDNLSKVYGQANPTLTGTVSGILNGDDVTAEFTTTASQFSDVQPGGYAIALAGLSGSKAGDYSTTVIGGSVTNGILTVTPAPLTVVADNQSMVYGQANPPLTGTVTGVLNGDDVTAEFTTTADQFSDVQPGGYAIALAALSGSKAGDYSTTVIGASVTNGVLTVTPAPLTVLVANQSKVYGQVNPAATGLSLGVLNGDDVSVIFSATAGQFSDVLPGGYAIVPIGLAGAKAADYSFSVDGASITPGVLTIVPAPLAIVVDNLSKVYGQANPTLTGTIAGALNNDDVGAGYATTATTSSDVVNGGYPITLTGLTGSKAIDYIIASSVPGSLTVTPAPLTVTASGGSKQYGQANPAFTASYGGFVLGQDQSVLSGALAFSTPATAAGHVGAYPVTPGGLTSANYTIIPVDGSLSITPAPLQVTASSVAKTYGQAVPDLLATYSGFVNGDTSASLTTPVSLSTTASTSSHVGQYPIVAGGAASVDYSIRYTNGSLSVTPAALTVTANDAVKPFIGPMPTFSATYSGFVNGDTPASLTTPVSLSTPATDTSAAGTYPINASGGSSADYSIVDVPGTLDIQAPVTPSYDPGQAAFVTSLYGSLLGRIPGPDAIGVWSNRLSRGMSRSTVAHRIYQSPEARAFRALHHGHGISPARAQALATLAEKSAAHG